MEFITLLLTSILVAIPTLYYINNYIKWYRTARIVNKIPGPRCLPSIGTDYTVWGAKEKRVQIQKEIHKKYGSIYRTWIGPIPSVHLLKAEYAEVLLKDTKNIIKGQGSKFITPWLGNSLVFSTGSLWHSRRKLLTPAFHFKILEDFAKVFIEKAGILADKLEEKSKNGEYIEILSTVKLCGLDIICKTAMGIELNAMDDLNRKYVEYTEKIAELAIDRILRPWLHYDFIFKGSTIGKSFQKVLSYLHGFTNNVIQEKKKQLRNKIKVENDKDETGVKTRLAFLDLVLEASDNGRVLTDEDIKNEVDTFMFAGHDTTTVATCWCLFLLGNQPEHQQKVHEELDRIFEDDRPINDSDVKEMKYLEMCIKEALRLYPSAPTVFRTIDHPIVIGKYEIPVGCSVGIHIDDIHRDPDHYAEPNRFNPDNFLAENVAKRHPYAFIPFSAGPRNCIGQKFAYLEEKILLATVLRRFKVKSLVKVEDMKVIHSMILRPQGGIKIKFERRTKNRREMDVLSKIMIVMSNVCGYFLCGWLIKVVAQSRCIVL